MALHKRRNPKLSTIMTMITKTPPSGVLHFKHYTSKDYLFIC